MRFSTAFFVLVATFQSIANGDARHLHNDPALKIINGTEAVVDSIPFMMFLGITFTDGSRTICGGTLLSEDYVLTAGHCVDDAARIEVYGGRYDIRTKNKSTMRLARSWDLHANYSRAYIDNDIAIIKLSTPMKESTSIGYTTLPDQSEAGNSYVGETMTTYGWGKIEDKSNEYSESLLYVDVDVISHSDCVDRMKKYPRFPIHVPDLDICTSKSSHKGTCHGDSGGPLLTDAGVQIGITSFGTPECEPDYPDVYVKVGNYLDWIKQHTP